MYHRCILDSDPLGAVSIVPRYYVPNLFAIKAHAESHLKPNLPSTKGMFRFGASLRTWMGHTVRQNIARCLLIPISQYVQVGVPILVRSNITNRFSSPSVPSRAQQSA